MRGALDYFAEPVIGRAFARTRWLAMTACGLYFLSALAIASQIRSLISVAGGLGMMVAGILCAVYIAVGRRWVREHFDLKGGAGVKSNADAFIGEKGLVLARVAPHHPGRVKVRQEEWRAVLDAASAAPIEAGTEITVTGVDGVTLQVR